MYFVSLSFFGDLIITAGHWPFSIQNCQMANHKIMQKAAKFFWLCGQLSKIIIGASLSEPHTRELGGEISVRMYVCLLACIRRTSRAN